MESNRLPRPGRALLTALGVLVALAVVVVASRGSTPVGEAGSRRPSDTLLDLFLTLYVIMLVLGAILFVYMLALQKSLRRKTGVGPVSPFSSLVVFILLLLALAGGRQLNGLERSPPSDEELVPRIGIPLPPGAQPNPEQEAYDPEFAWIPVIVFVALLALGVGTVWWASFRRRRAHTAHEPPTLGEALADVLDETLDALHGERDPRRAVIAAYARLERVLAAHGLARRPSEAPLEYLGRVLADLSVSASGVRRLTLLFQRAKFSQHEVGEAMKDEAIGALRTVQDELRAAEALAQLERERAARPPAERAEASG